MKKSIAGILPKLAKKVGEKSVSSACTWWIYQPKVPESMKKSDNTKWNWSAFSSYNMLDYMIQNNK